MILRISLRAKGGVPKTLLEQKHRLNFLYFPQSTLMLTESREEFSDLHSIFRLRALRYLTHQRALYLILLYKSQTKDYVIFISEEDQTYFFKNKFLTMWHFKTVSSSSSSSSLLSTTTLTSSSSSTLSLLKLVPH